LPGHRFRDDPFERIVREQRAAEPGNHRRR
jgi:hypothetical protein